MDCFYLFVCFHSLLLVPRREQAPLRHFLLEVLILLYELSPTCGATCPTNRIKQTNSPFLGQLFQDLPLFLLLPLLEHPLQGLYLHRHPLHLLCNRTPALKLLQLQLVPLQHQLFPLTDNPLSLHQLLKRFEKSVCVCVCEREREKERERECERERESVCVCVCV